MLLHTRIPMCRSPDNPFRSGQIAVSQIGIGEISVG